MITSFEVGAVFQIIDRATPVISRLAAEVRALDTAVALTRKNLVALGHARNIQPLVTGLTAAQAQVRGITASTRTMNAGLATSTANANRLAAALTSAAVAGAAARTSVPVIPGGGRGGGGGGGGHGGRAGVGLSGISTGIPMAVGHASAHLRGPGTGALVGGAVAAWGLQKTMKAGIEPLHQKALLSLLGLSDGETDQVMTRAWQTAKDVKGSAIGSNIKTIGEMYSIVGLEGAMSLSPHMATLDRVMAASGKGKEEGSAYVLTRAAELMGRLTDPNTHQVDLKGFGSFLDVMSRGVIATHGKITPAEMLNYAKQAGPASGSLTGEGLMTTFAVIQAMGGHRAGTAAAALQRQFAGGIMSQRTAGELTRLGIAEKDDFEVKRGGQVVAKTDAMKAMVDRLQKDPLSAIVDVIIPALEKNGITSNEAISREIYRFIGTGPAQREVYELIRGREQIAQERARMQKAMPAGTALGALIDKDPEQNLKAFSAAFHNLLAAIGSPMMAATLPVLNALTGSMNAMAEAASRHPTASNIAGTTMGGIAAGAALGFGIGWLGGPIGAGAGAIIGGAAGFGYGLLTSPNLSPNAPAAWPAVAASGRNSSLWGNDGGAAFGAVSQQRHVTVQANVTVKAETDNPEGLANKLMAVFNDMIAKGFTHTQSEGEGPLSSPYAGAGAGG